MVSVGLSSKRTQFARYVVFVALVKRLEAKVAFCYFLYFTVVMVRKDNGLGGSMDFCADDDRNDYFTPCACARGKRKTIPLHPTTAGTVPDL